MERIKADEFGKLIAKLAFPDYRGRKIFIEPQRYPLNCASYWEGGSRSYFVFVRLADKSVSQEVPAQSGFDKPVSGIKEVTIPEGFVCVEHVYFCGKDLGLRVHVNPENLAALLP